MKRIHHQDALAHARTALSMGGEQTGLTSVFADYAARCENPHRVELVGRPDAAWGGSTVLIGGPTDGRKTMHLDLDVRCRKCSSCLRARAALWRFRAQTEIACAARTWFGTLTLSPQEHYLALCRADRAKASRAVDLNTLSPEHVFMARHNAITPLITRWLKRVRKESGAELRYLLVAEAHKSGLPHYHLLVHESSLEHPVRHRTLDKQWTHGFSTFNLVGDGKPARYVTKYLTKTVAARVRASVRYGQPPGVAWAKRPLATAAE